MRLHYPIRGRPYGYTLGHRTGWLWRDNCKNIGHLDALLRAKPAGVLRTLDEQTNDWLDHSRKSNKRKTWLFICQNRFKPV